jgi:8-oxo-dGTP diphosphatase
MDEYNTNIIQSKYALVPRTLIFVEKEGQILFLNKENKLSFGYGKLNGLGGHIEKGEDPYETARREVYEEAGINIKDLELTAIIFIDIGISPGILVFVFKGKYESGTLNKSNEGSLLWVNRYEIAKKEGVIKDVPYLINICDEHTAGAPPKIIKYDYDEKGELRIAISHY